MEELNSMSTKTKKKLQDGSLIACLDGGGKEGSRVVLAKNKLIFC